MDMHQLNLTKGTWLVGNCGKHPTGNHCKMVFIAPENQKTELVETIVQHAIDIHEEEDTQKLRSDINKILETVKV